MVQFINFFWFVGVFCRGGMDEDEEHPGEAASRAVTSGYGARRSWVICFVLQSCDSAEGKPESSESSQGMGTAPSATPCARDPSPITPELGICAGTQRSGPSVDGCLGIIAHRVFVHSRFRWDLFGIQSVTLLSASLCNRCSNRLRWVDLSDAISAHRKTKSRSRTGRRATILQAGGCACSVIVAQRDTSLPHPTWRSCVHCNVVQHWIAVLHGRCTSHLPHDVMTS